MKIGIGLGSNQGDRKANLDQAIAFLKQLSAEVTVSSYYQSAPLDCPPGSEFFWNAVAEIEFSDGVSYLLKRLQEFEKQMGRPDEGNRGRNAPRTIDLDILYAEELEMNTSRLIIPHPRLKERLFVLLPLSEILPNRTIAGTGKTVHNLLEELDKEGQECHQID